MGDAIWLTPRKNCTNKVFVLKTNNGELSSANPVTHLHFINFNIELVKELKKPLSEQSLHKSEHILISSNWE